MRFRSVSMGRKVATHTHTHTHTCTHHTHKHTGVVLFQPTSKNCVVREHLEGETLQSAVPFGAAQLLDHQILNINIGPFCVFCSRWCAVVGTTIFTGAYPLGLQCSPRQVSCGFGFTLLNGSYIVRTSANSFTLFLYECPSYNAKRIRKKVVAITANSCCLGSQD